MANGFKYLQYHVGYQNARTSKRGQRTVTGNVRISKENRMDKKEEEVKDRAEEKQEEKMKRG